MVASWIDADIDCIFFSQDLSHTSTMVAEPILLHGFWTMSLKWLSPIRRWKWKLVISQAEVGWWNVCWTSSPGGRRNRSSFEEGKEKWFCRGESQCNGRTQGRLGCWQVGWNATSEKPWDSRKISSSTNELSYHPRNSPKCWGALEMEINSNNDAYIYVSLPLFMVSDRDLLCAWAHRYAKDPCV